MGTYLNQMMDVFNDNVSLIQNHNIAMLMVIKER